MSKILVVDDTAIFRDPIAATLRRAGFETLTASNGQEALAMLKQQPVDMILLDVAMPVMDGLTCLRELRKDPATRNVPVIILSAMSEREVVVKAAQVGVHGYLLKSSFSKDHLLDLVGKHLPIPSRQPPSQGLPSSSSPTPVTPCVKPVEPSTRKVSPPKGNPELVKHIIEKLRLKPMSPVLHQILLLANRSSSSIDDLVKMIRQDPAMTLRVLRISNSSFYGAKRAAQNLTEAVQRIGVSGIRNAVAAISAIEQFSEQTSSGLVPQRFWEHSLATATLAQALGEAAEIADAEQLFLAGLFHDMGRMMLAITQPDQYRDVMLEAERRAIDLSIAEQEMLGLDHVDVTKSVLNEWKMPEAIMDPALNHSVSLEQILRASREPKSAVVLSLADKFAHAALLGDSGNAMILPVLAMVDYLNLGDKLLAGVLADTIEKVQEIGLFYASQSDHTYREAYAAELARTAQIRPRITSLNPDCGCDATSLFIKQMGWYEDTSPEIAILQAASQENIQQGFHKLQRLEQGQSNRLGLLIVQGQQQVDLPPELLASRPSSKLQIPCRYATAIEAIKGLVAARKNVRAAGLS